MQYIKLEDVQKLLNLCLYALPLNSEKRELIDKLNREIPTLPSIDFEEMIFQLKRKNKKSSDYCDDKLAWPVREKLIEEFEELLKLPK